MLWSAPAEHSGDGALDARCQYRERTGVPARASRVGWWLRPDQIIISRNISIPSLPLRVPTKAASSRRTPNYYCGRGLGDGDATGLVPIPNSSGSGSLEVA